MLNRALRLLRTYHQLTQTELAERLGISNSYLSELEKGVKKEPSIELLTKYAEIFNMPVSSILLFSEQMDSKSITGNKLRISAADKILKLLEWINDRESIRDRA